jgi:tRNA (adenine22-N1)-methyltransferase
MNKRLLTIAKHIEPGIGFIDVGTDHGYIPTWMAQHGYNGNIIASDINAAPLQTAVNTANKSGVDDKIQFQLCDGLSQCTPESVDTIVIAGMGGDMICKILDLAEWCMKPDYKLILQPMTKCEVLRYWLSNNEFEILTEEQVLDGGTIYQVIVARFGGHTKLCDAELFIGKRALCTDLELYEQQRIKLIKRFTAALNGMSKTTQEAKTPGYKLYQNILNELERI